MYSLVLATMLTAGSATPSLHFGYHGCHGCYGCYGCYGSCHGCYGCYGSCHGCYGSWYGCSGCYGSCTGCWGVAPVFYGTYSSCSGCYGCYGSCYGCYGSWYGYYGSAYVAPVVVASPVAVPAPPVTGGPVRVLGDARKIEAPATARVTIVVPDGAKLFVNDQPVAVQPGTRTFETPQLERGKPYHYVFKAEVPVDGKVARDVQKVEVAAGREVKVEFTGLPSAAAARR